VKSVIGLAILVAAHRGGAQLWPENSLLAFGNALAWASTPWRRTFT